MDALAKLDELMAAEAAAWAAACERPGIATEDPEWKAAADAEFAHRHAKAGGAS